MQKIKQEKLIKQDNIYYYDNERFNGVIFFIKNFMIKAKKVCRNGQVVRDYINPYFANNFTLHIDKDALDIPRYYQGKPFTGIVYKFQGSFCIEETEYRDGVGANNLDYDESKNYSGLCSINYYKIGTIREFKRKDNNFLQEFEWYKNSNIQSISVGESTEAYYTFGIDLIFNEDNRIKLVYLDEYFAEFDKIKKKIKFNILPSREELIKIPLANNISFSGEDIDDKLLKDFFEKSNLKDVKEISFYQTSLTKEGYEILLEISSLQKVHLRGYNLAFDDVVDRLREKGVEVEITIIR